MAKEIGGTGLSVFSGQIHDEFLRELRGKDGYKRFDEMRRNSPVIGAMLFYIEQAIRKCSWNFVNKDNRDAQDERVDFLNECREYMSQSWNEFISEVLTFVPFGFSLFWVNYKRLEDNRMGWDSFSPRKQNTIYRWILNYPNQEGYDPNKRIGEIMGVTQQAPPVYTLDVMPIDRLLHFRTRIEGNNPEGISLLRNSWFPYYYWKNYHSLEGVGFERDLNGMPVIKMPQGASTDENDANSDASKAAMIVRNLRNDEQAGVVLPFGWELNLLSSSGKGFADIGAAIERLESRQLMSLLAQFIMLGQNGTGSLALSNDSTSIAEMIVNSLADIIVETFTKQEIPRILSMNGYDYEDICLEHSPAGDSDIAALADFLQKAGDKITWTAKDELWLRQGAGLPEMTVEELQSAMDEKALNAPTFTNPFQPKPQRPAAMPMNQDMQQPEPMMEQNTVTLFGVGDPLDKRKRDKVERQIQATMFEFQQKQKRRIMAWARTMQKAKQ